MTTIAEKPEGTEDLAAIRAEQIAANHRADLARVALNCYGVSTPNPVRSRAQARRDKARERDADVVKTWPTKYGAVVQTGSVRVYTGKCQNQGCRASVTKTRDVKDRRVTDRTGEKTWVGRWPKYCEECLTAREEAHRKADDAKAAERMRELREARRMSADARWVTNR